jgi:LmbE family N-acetylglucosaminyl deacetylase
VLGAASVHHLDLEDGSGGPDIEEAGKLREVVGTIAPDVVLLPWYLDNQRDHRVTNVLYAWSCQDIECMVLGFEVWSLCQPNAVFDITRWVDEKVELVKTYQTQLATIDYLGYVRGLARTRAFLQNARGDRGGAAEAFFALPNRDYCELVRAFYGEPGRLNSFARPLL